MNLPYTVIPLPSIVAAIASMWSSSSRAYSVSFATIHVLIGISLLVLPSVLKTSEKTARVTRIRMLTMGIQSLVAIVLLSHVGNTYSVYFPTLKTLPSVGKDTIQIGRGWEGYGAYRALFRKYTPTVTHKSPTTKLTSSQLRSFLCDVLGADATKAISELPQSVDLRYFAKSDFKCGE